MSKQSSKTSESPITESPGSFLQALRLKRGLSERDLAEQLHLLPNSIKAIEADDYDSFNAEVYVRGYLRSYAKALQIEPDLVISKYDAYRENHLPEVSDKDVSQQARRKIPSKSLSRFSLETKSQLPYFGATAFLLVVAVLWWQGEEPAITSHDLLVNNVVAIDEVVVDALVNTKASSVVDASEQVISETIQQPDLLVTNTVVPEDDVILPEQVVISEEDLLQFSFSGDCWVEVKDSEDNILIAAMKHAEDTLHLEGQGPFRILLGYAPVVKLNFNGERVQIQPSARNNSAKLVLGRS
jgi:cytoskeleton protein RodZ